MTRTPRARVGLSSRPIPPPPGRIEGSEGGWRKFRGLASRAKGLGIQWFAQLGRLGRIFAARACAHVLSRGVAPERKHDEALYAYAVFCLPILPSPPVVFITFNKINRMAAGQKKGLGRQAAQNGRQEAKIGKQALETGNQAMKQISIVKLLEWAYRHELPKAERPGGGMTASAPSSWGMVYNLGILGTVIDAPLNGYGVVAVGLDEGDPHPDALRVGEAVAGLASAKVSIGDDWSPFPEWADADGLVAETVTRLRPRLASLTGKEIQTMLIARAVLGRKPDWRGDEPGRAMITRGGKPAWFMKEAGQDAYGKPVEREVDGLHPRSRRPRPGAYRKYRLTNDVAGLAEDRFRRTVWALAVRHVAQRVAFGLLNHQLSAEVPTLSPWSVVAGLPGQGDPSHSVSLFL